MYDVAICDDEIKDRKFMKKEIYENENYGVLPMYSYDTGFKHIVDSKTANGINLHAAGALSESTWSIGCLTVSENDYYKFGIMSGFIKDRKDGKAYNKYKEIKTLKFDYSMYEKHWGYVVVNRKYMNSKE